MRFFFDVLTNLFHHGLVGDHRDGEKHATELFAGACPQLDKDSLNALLICWIAIVQDRVARRPDEFDEVTESARRDVQERSTVAVL